MIYRDLPGCHLIGLVIWSRVLILISYIYKMEFTAGIINGIINGISDQERVFTGYKRWEGYIRIGIEPMTTINYRIYGGFTVYS
jgi:hypothetical protein